MRRGENLDGVPRNTEGLLQGESSVMFRRGGKMETSRVARAREFSDSVLGTTGSPEHLEYTANLRARIMAGEAPHMESYLNRLKHGDPPKNKENDDDASAARFEELRENMNALLRDNPELARQLAAAQARRSSKLAVMPRRTIPALPLPPANDDEIL